MPSAQSSRRVARCCYEEGGRRCRRSATGNPPLCNPHKIAVSEQVRREASRGAPGQPLGDGVLNLADRLLNRKRVSKKVLEEAAADVIGWWDQMQQNREQREPTREPLPNEQHTERPSRGTAWYDDIAARARKVAEEATRRAEQARQQQQATDPRAAQERVSRARARQTLGFDPVEEITAEKLKTRQRELAKKHHPDRGGSVTKMQEINAAVDVLAKSLVS